MVNSILNPKGAGRLRSPLVRRSRPSASVGGGWLYRQAFRRRRSGLPAAASLAAAPGRRIALILLAGFAAWKLARAGAYSWLLPLAALNLAAPPARAAPATSRTWRLEWGVMGLAWTLAAVLVFARLLRRSDELERRLHLEGAFYGLATGLVGLRRLRPLRDPPPRAARAEWVAVALAARRGGPAPSLLARRYGGAA